MAAPVLQVKEIEPPRLPRRKRDAHKGDFGRLFILGGSRERNHGRRKGIYVITDGRFASEYKIHSLLKARRFPV